jgi:hypothetical protein
MVVRTLPQVVARSSTAGYIAAVAVPVAITYSSAWLTLPPFVFEHLVVLLVLAIAIPWGIGPAASSAL